MAGVFEPCQRFSGSAPETVDPEIEDPETVADGDAVLPAGRFPRVTSLIHGKPRMPAFSCLAVSQSSSIAYKYRLHVNGQPFYGVGGFHDHFGQRGMGMDVVGDLCGGEFHHLGK